MDTKKFRRELRQPLRLNPAFTVAGLNSRFFVSIRG